jgi:hypothetical protein
LAIIDTITKSKKNLKMDAIKVLKCQMYGKLKIPCSAKWNLKNPKSNLIAAINAIDVSNTK